MKCKSLFILCALSGWTLTIQAQRVVRPSAKPGIQARGPVMKPHIPVRHQVSRPLKPSDFHKTTLAGQRNALYGTSYTNPSKTFTFADGTRLHVNLIKNPPFQGMSNTIQPNASNPTAAPSNAQSDWACTTSTITVTAQTTDFSVADYSLQAPRIYPGAIYTADSYLSGTFHTPAGVRNPITIATDNPNTTGPSYLEVANPSQATLQNAVAQLFSHLSTSGGNGSTQYSYYESYNTSDWTLKVSAGGSGFGSSLNNTYKNSNKDQHRYLTIDATKQLFSIYTNPPTDGFFTSPTVEATPNLIAIGEVTYGVRILANLEITFSSQSDGDDFDAKFSYDGFSANLGLSYLQSKSSDITSINAYEIGGPNTGAVAIDKNSLVTSINDILKGATYQNARPIRYELYDMAWNPIGAKSATDQFTYRNCVPAEAPPMLSSASVSVRTGPDGKDYDTHYRYDLYNAAGQLVASYVNNHNNTEWTENSSNHNNTLNVVPGHKMTEFMNGSPKFKISVFPNGNDDIKQFSVDVTLNFNNNKGTAPQQGQLHWANNTLTKGGPVLTLPFIYANGKFATQ